MTNMSSLHKRNYVVLFSLVAVGAVGVCLYTNRARILALTVRSQEITQVPVQKSTVSYGRRGCTPQNL